MTNAEQRTRTALRCTAATLGLLALAVGMIMWRASTPSFDGDVLAAIAFLSIAAALATNFEIEIRPNVSMSGHIMVTMASMVVFWKESFLVGPLLVGLLSGFYFVHLRSHQFSKVIINSSLEVISLVPGLLAFWAIANHLSGSVIGFFLGVCAAAIAFGIANSLLLSVPVALISKERYRSVVPQIAYLNVLGLPFALFGLGFAWTCLAVGFVVAPLLLVPLFIARRTFASYLELKAAQEQTIETLILALEAKDRYTAGHAQRVATFCEYIGQELNFGPRRMERLRYAALMHDIGKLIVPNQLLNKPGRLTESEFARVKRHESVSVDLLRRIDFLAPIAGDTTTEAASAAAKGDGLVEPAIIHVADAFDAMTSTRSYRKALSQEVAFDELRAGAGTQFHAECVGALIAAIERRGEQYGAGHEDDVHEWEVAPPEAGTGSAGLGDLAEEHVGTP